MITPHLARNQFDDGKVQFQSIGAFYVRDPQLPTSTTSSISPSPTSSGSDSMIDGSSQGHGFGKAILEYIFLGVAVTLVVAIVFRRIRGLKPANQSYWAFFVALGHRSSEESRLPSYPRTPAIPLANGERLPHPPYPDSSLAGLPASYRGFSNRRTRAQDVDAAGRRLGNRADLDHDGALDDKDILPAYDVYGGPPKYYETGLNARLSGVEDAHPPIDEFVNQTAEWNAVVPQDATHGELDEQNQASLDPPGSPNLFPGSHLATNTTTDATSTDAERPS